MGKIDDQPLGKGNPYESPLFVSLSIQEEFVRWLDTTVGIHIDPPAAPAPPSASDRATSRGRGMPAPLTLADAPPTLDANAVAMAFRTGAHFCKLVAFLENIGPRGRSGAAQASADRGAISGRLGISDLSVLGVCTILPPFL